MKRWITFILSFYILLSAVVPCSFFDNCEEKLHTQQSSQKEQKKDCDNCTPFCACSSAHNFTINKIYFLAIPVAINDLPVYGEYHISLQFLYLSSFFQPPQNG